MNMIKFIAAAWMGACIRNENDRKKTLEFFNSIGNESEKIIKSLFQGVNHAQSVQPTEGE